MSTLDEHEEYVNLEYRERRKSEGFWVNHGQKFIFTVALILVALASFEAGLLKGKKEDPKQIVVKSPDCPPCEENENQCEKQVSANMNDTAKNPGTSEQAENEKVACAYVASKNSDKYHLASCQWATRIKAENKVCFSSQEEAASRGYKGAKCCIK